MAWRSWSARKSEIGVPAECCWSRWIAYHTRIPFTELAVLQRAIALGRIDFWVVKGWVTPEEWLYPQVQEALSAWTITHRPHHVVYRVVGEQLALCNHHLRDILSRNGVAVRFLSGGLAAEATVAPRLLS